MNGAVKMVPSEDKAVKWTNARKMALLAKAMPAGDASKYGGRLAFASLFAFRRMGRAMIRPFYQQQYKPLPFGRMRPSLSMASMWWIQVLEARVAQQVLTGIIAKKNERKRKRI